MYINFNFRKYITLKDNLYLKLRERSVSLFLANILIMKMDLELLERAKFARNNAYAPYSNYKVGAALLTKSGKIYSGCNVEDVSTRAGACAERVAIFNAISNGEEKDFEKILIIGGNSNDRFDKITPCGTCRQMLFEFCEPDFEIINYYIENGQEKLITYKLSELLPHSFKI